MFREVFSSLAGLGKAYALALAERGAAVVGKDCSSLALLVLSHAIFF